MQLAANVASNGSLEAHILQITRDCAQLRQELARQLAKVSQMESCMFHLEKDLDISRQEVNTLRSALTMERDDLNAKMADQTVKLEEAEKMLMSQAAEISKVTKANESLSELSDRRSTEVKELSRLLKAWEAMRMGKDAQIASLIERGKRSEEEIAEKTRTIEALRRKLTGR